MFPETFWEEKWNFKRKTKNLFYHPKLVVKKVVKNFPTLNASNYQNFVFPIFEGHFERRKLFYREA